MSLSTTAALASGLAEGPRAARGWHARLRENLPALALTLAFVLLLWPIADDVSRYHNDERFYTDASIQMVERGDWTTPRYWDGSLRARKPLMSYWLIAASYSLFGIGLFASRLPFLLAGGAIVWMTWRSARLLLGDARTAWLAALITASSVHLFTLATRSTPDVLVMLFSVLALHGFAAVCVAGRDHPLHRAQAWSGSGLAVATKGGLGLVLVAGVALFRKLASRRHLHGRESQEARVFASPWILFGLALSCAGLVPMLLHDQAIGGLVEDQVAGRLGLSPFEVLTNGAHYVLDLAVSLLPWSLLLVVGLFVDRALLARILRERRALAVFVLLWAATLVVVFAFGNIHRGRYLAPALPWLAIVCAPLLDGLWQHGRCARALHAGSKWFALGLALVLLGLTAWLPSDLPRGERVGQVLLGLLALALFFALLLRGREFGLAALGLAMLFGQSLALAVLRPGLQVSPAPALAARLAELGIDGQRIATYGMHPRLSSQLRVLSGGAFDPIPVPENAPLERLAPFDALILPAPPTSELQSLGLRFEPCGFAVTDWTPGELLACRTDEDARAAFARHRVDYYLGVRAPGVER